MNEINKSLTRKEELILLSILNLKGNAYLIAIVDHLTKILLKKVSVTSVYFPLDRLEKRELIASAFGEATAIRGGRRKKIYSITKLGYEVLEEHKRVSDLLWENYAGLSSPKE
jgi:PadR family transcriptional regulator PadR